MKIRELNLITEAVRFGNKERQQIMKVIQNFRFGLEYEFNLTAGIPFLDKLAPLDTPEDSPLIVSLNPYFAKIFRTYKKLNEHGGASLLDEYVGDMDDYMQGSADEAEVEYFTDSVIPDIRDMCAWFLAGVVSPSEKINKEFPNDSLDGFGVLRDSVEIRELKAIQNMAMLPEITRITPAIALAAHDAANGLSQYIEEDCENLTPRMTEAQYLNGVAAIMHADLSEYRSKTPGKLDIVRADLKSPMIDHILPDVTVPDGVEVITKPLNFQDTMTVMDELFDYIDSKGSTDNTTGLHVNISTTGDINMNDVNFVKMMTLLDVDFFQNMSPNSQKLIKYPVRSSWVTPITRFLGNDNGLPLLKLARAYAYNGMESFIRMFESLVKSDNQKERAVNMKHLLHADVSQRRVEMRFLGGKDYHHRRNEIEDDILRFCYMIAAGASDDFMRREYAENIVRILDRAVRLYDVDGAKYSSFSTLVNFVRKQQ